MFCGWSRWFFSKWGRGRIVVRVGNLTWIVDWVVILLIESAI